MYLKLLVINAQMKVTKANKKNSICLNNQGTLAKKSKREKKR